MNEWNEVLVRNLLMLMRAGQLHEKCRSMSQGKQIQLAIEQWKLDFES